MQNERIKNDRMGGSSGLVTGVALAFSNIKKAFLYNNNAKEQTNKNKNYRKVNRRGTELNASLICVCGWV